MINQDDHDDEDNGDWNNMKVLPQPLKHLTIMYDNEVYCSAYLDKEGEWHDSGGRKLDKQLVTKWTYISEKK